MKKLILFSLFVFATIVAIAQPKYTTLPGDNVRAKKHFKADSSITTNTATINTANIANLNPGNSKLTDSINARYKTLQIGINGTRIDSVKVVADSVIFYMDSKRFKMIKY